MAGSCVLKNVCVLDSYIPDSCISSLKKQTILMGKMQNYLQEISYIACGLIHFYKELAIERSLLNRMGCVVTWVTWLRGLRGSNFYVG